jgi:hypothetical protein
MIRARAAWRQVLIIALAGCAAAAALGGCAAAGAAAGGPAPEPPPRSPDVVVRDGAGNHTATVTVGQWLEVVLGSTYWTVAGSSRPAVLRQDGASVSMARPASCPKVPPGMGCIPIRTDFTALKPGTAVITASRISCGEAMECAPNQRNFTLTVTVRATK